jgi:hypothetical protein
MMIAPLLFKNLQNSDFYQFFNIHPIKTNQNIKRLNPGVFKYFKPGGFLEYVDLLFRINENDQLTGALLILDRAWVGNQKSLNPFGMDIAKSFLDAIAPEPHPPDWIEVINLLKDLHGEADHVIHLHPESSKTHSLSDSAKNFMLTYMNLNTQHELRYKNARIEFENYDDLGKMYFIIDFRIDMLIKEK